MPQITLNDCSLKDYELTDRVSALRVAYFKALPEICTERPRHLTDFHLKHGLFDKDRIGILDKAKAYRYALEERKAVVWHERSYGEGMKPFEFTDRSLFAGSTTTRFKGVPLYPEFLALTLWPELWSISKRKNNPFHITEREAQELNEKIFPHWIEKNITELARTRCYKENLEKLGLKKHAPEMELLERLVFFLVTKPACISHTLPEFSKVIKFGLKSIIDDAAKKAAASTDDSKKEFYLAISEALKGVIAYSHKLAAKARELAENEIDEGSKRELMDIAEINERVPEHPARSFREGLTTVWICWTAIHIENSNAAVSLGRLDQVLYDLYRKDIDNEVMGVGDAIELLCCMWLKIGDHVPSIPDAGEQLLGGAGSNQAITIGGVDCDGNDAVNDLTYVMLRATELMKLRDPNLNARYYSGINSRQYLDRLCDANINTGATPALHNDKAIIKALTSKGESLEHARDYGVIGCVEPNSNGRTYGHTGAILLNLTSALELTLFNGCHRHTGLEDQISMKTGDPARFTSFDDFKEAFKKQALWLVEQTTTLNNICGRVHQDFYPTPILSALFEGPMDKGKDLIQGGAVINSSGATVIGLADVADSLSAIEKVVFKEGALTMADLLDALEKNFKGYETLQERLMDPVMTPKYGNEDPDADANVSWILEMMDSAFGSTENYRGGRYRVGYWTMTNHAAFGRLMQATPNGRKARENFTSGITPVSNVTPCLTSALNSVANQSAAHLSSGVALNLKYTPELSDKSRMINDFAATVEGYFDDKDQKRDGGVEIQFNVTTHKTFIEAMNNPKKYPELLVRVSGYTAYFKDLNPQMQKEIVDRTEYLLSKGQARRFDPLPLPKMS